jgi:hypothetical protein
MRTMTLNIPAPERPSPRLVDLSRLADAEGRAARSGQLARIAYVTSAFALAAGIALAGSVISAWAQAESAPTSGNADATPATWPELPQSFESTGGGGWMITEYRPVVDGSRCATDFVAVGPDGTRVRNRVEWTAKPLAGGTLCSEGRWRAADGSGSGTTPLEVYIKDGVVRRVP